MAITLSVLALCDAACEGVDALQKISLLGTRAFAGHGALFPHLGIAGGITAGLDSAITEVSTAFEVAKMACGK